MSNSIRFHRERAGFTQANLAIKSGVTADYLCCLEEGRERLWTVRLAPIAEVLEVPVATLMI